MGQFHSSFLSFYPSLSYFFLLFSYFWPEAGLIQSCLAERTAKLWEKCPTSSQRIGKRGPPGHCRRWERRCGGEWGGKSLHSFSVFSSGLVLRAAPVPVEQAPKTELSLWPWNWEQDPLLSEECGEGIVFPLLSLLHSKTGSITQGRVAAPRENRARNMLSSQRTRKKTDL